MAYSEGAQAMRHRAGKSIEALREVSTAFDCDVAAACIDGINALDLVEKV